MKRHGFTLIELLVVLSILALLAAILFPVFSSVRARARQTACLSNLRQIGLGVFLYAQDEDDLFPRGGDAADRNTDDWRTADGGKYWPEAHLLPSLQDVLRPYVPGKELWHCPADTGFESEDAGDDPIPLPAHPTSYDAFGLSYYYRTALTLQRQTLSGLTAYEPEEAHAQHGPAEINLLCDGTGFWHGDADTQEERFNTLLADGHAASLTKDRLYRYWEFNIGTPGNP